MSHAELFVAGAIGAAAPEIVRAYRLRHGGISIRHPRRYWIVSVLFVGLGGALVIFLDATSLYAAFYMGISLPAVVSAAGGRTGAIKTRKTKRPVERTADGDVAHRFDLRDYLGALFGSNS